MPQINMVYRNPNPFTDDLRIPETKQELLKLPEYQTKSSRNM